ncbi:Ig-like domain (group 3) [Mariniphaga anaerophila]|uniref:Ig-like domain (Group 3) n=1 Tax=Mariniphaga anaerophila TaxID=1484053 RepID=A0A1M4TNX4_9BACT|nr:T9SS type A sorting domain-containing protein [Mariniphaga anaerophila]SHE46076.1 Ig-like domain (group 3) [Mariniphaga anaerophila]
MKQKYLFSLVCSVFLLASQLSVGQSFSHKSDLNVERTRSSSKYSKTVKFADLFNFPEGYDEKAEIAESDDVVISFSSTNESTLLFDGYYHSSYSGQWFYYTIPPGAYGKDTLTVRINYNGVDAEAFVFADIAPIIAGNDSYTTDIGGTLEMNLVRNDQPSAYLDKASIEILRGANYGTLTNSGNGVFTYESDESTPNYSFENLEYRIADTDGNYDTAMVKISIHKNAYASRVVEFMPAPGQFTNESIAQSGSAEKTLGENATMISLGAFGGYVIFGFDQPIVNHPQNPYGVDFSIKGNAFSANLYGVWTEPAAVRVMKDVNGDGIPNDSEWYELAGSDYYMSSTQKNVKMTYYNPHYDSRYTVPWKKDNGETGALLSNAFHSHPYYPDPFDFGCDKDSMTYEGNIIKSTLDMSTPSYVEFYRAPIFGYCDSRGNSSDLTDPQNPYKNDEKGKAADGFDLSWAVDKDGNHVPLDQIDFVKIYTAGFANAGWLGEWSSEVAGVGITTPDPDYVPEDYYINYIGITQLKVLKGQTCQFEGFLFKNGRPQEEGTQQWSSSASGVGTVDNTGLFTAVENGETWLRFSQKDDIPTDSIRLIVVELEGVVLEMEGNSGASSDSTKLFVGETISITAQGEDNIGDVLNGSTSNRYTYDTYTWTTSNPEVGKIDNGLFTGRQVGRTMVYAHSDSNPELFDSILVIVNKVPELSPVDNPVVISYYDPVGAKTSGELFETGTNSTTYLNSVVSKNGIANPVIEKNTLKCNFTEGEYGTDTLQFNLTSYKRDTTISVVFVYEPDGYDKKEQILFVNDALVASPDKSSLNSYFPESGEIRVIDNQLDSHSVKDVLVDGAFAFVSGDDFLFKYNVTTNAKADSVEFGEPRGGALAVYNNLLLIAGQSNLSVYYKSDLTLSKNIALSEKTHSVKVVGDKAYVFLLDEETGRLSNVVVVDLILGAVESQTSLSSAELIPSTVLAKGNKLYVTGTLVASGNAAVLEYDAAGNSFSVSDTGTGLTNTLNAEALITDDSILLANGGGFVAFNISTKTLDSEILMKGADDFYPTGVVYHASLDKYFATYSNAAQTNSKGFTFDANFAKGIGFGGVETGSSFLRSVMAFDANEKPLANERYSMPKVTTYEMATSNTTITIYKNRFTDQEDNFEIYPRYLEHASWLTWYTSYTSSGNKRLYARFTNTVDKDSVVTIAVDAIDSYGFSATRTIDITIKPRIYKPVVLNPVADIEIEENSAALQISLAGVFEHSTSSGVSFSKSVSGNSNAELINTDISSDILTLSPTADLTGEATITLRETGTHSTYGEKFAETSFNILVYKKSPTVPTELSGVPTESSIAISWTASVDYTGVAGYNVYVDGVLVNTVTETNDLIEGLESGTEYTLEVEAFDGEGNKSERAALTVLTADHTAPSMPANLTAVPSETSITLSWNASTDNVGVIGYNVHVNGYLKAHVGGTKCTIPGLKLGNEYAIEVEAVDSARNKSERASTTVLTIDETAPAIPTDLAAVPAETTIALFWTASTDNVEVAGYNIYVNGSMIDVTPEPIYTATGLSAATEYTLEVEAFDGAGNKSEKALVTVSTIDETAPATPVNLVALPAEASIALSWDEPTDNAGVTGYNVYVNGSLANTVAETSCLLTGLDVTTEYTIEVEAFDAAGNISEKASGNVSTIDETAPTAPTNLDATPAELSFALSWDASTDNIGVAGYVIYLDGDLVDSVSETIYSITDLNSNTEYVIEVAAFDAAGNKSEKATITRKTITTGIDLFESARLQAYPNPFDNYIRVIAKTEGSAVLYDLSGKAMMNILLKTGSNKIDAAGLPGGVYLLKQGTQSIKLIKQ